MKTGDKENAMTVSLSKRLFEGDATTASLTSPTPASKKMRMLSPLAEHVGAACQTKPGAAGVGALQQQHHSSARKRRHDTSTEHSSGVASPLNSGKRGKRGDGRPSTAAASPNTAKSALEALLTCEGLEKDADLEAEVAYITARQSTAGRTSAAGAGNNNDAAGASSSGAAAGAAEQDTPVAAARPGSSSAVLDAARSSREKRRDQDQNPRARRASGGARSSRDQANLASPETDSEAPPATDLFGAAAAATAAADPQPDSPRPVTLDLIGDKEWDRLFAVLTLSDSASACHSSSSGSSSSAAADGQAGAAAAAAADDRGVGVRSHRLSCAVGTSAATAAAGGAAVQEAPGTPVRRQEGGSSGGNPAEPTPSWRSSFLAGEWQRVQQQRLNTPPRAAAGAANPAAFAPFTSDCDMGL